MSKKDFDFRMFGVQTIGEKGQVVIPKNAREKLGFAPGDELVVFGSCDKKFVGAMKEEDFRGFLAKMGKHVDEWLEKADGEKSEIKK